MMPFMIIYTNTTCFIERETSLSNTREKHFTRMKIELNTGASLSFK